MRKQTRKTKAARIISMTGGFSVLVTEEGHRAYLDEMTGKFVIIDALTHQREYDTVEAVEVGILNIAPIQKWRYEGSEHRMSGTDKLQTRVSVEQGEFIRRDCRLRDESMMDYLRRLVAEDMQRRGVKDYPSDPKHGGNRRLK